jgi:hypothetical protein
MGADRSRIRPNPSSFARRRSFAYNILKANHTGTLNQDRYRAALGGSNGFSTHPSSEGVEQPWQHPRKDRAQKYGCAGMGAAISKPYHFL